MSGAGASKHLPAAYAADNKKCRVIVTCCKCGRREVGVGKPNFPPEVLSKLFTRSGWDIYRNGVKATCPDCKHKRETEMMSREAIIAQAKCFDLLKDHCTADGRTARYDKDWDDERVSRETGLSLDLVREARESLRPGALADPVIESLEQDIASARARATSELTEIRQFLDNIEAEHGRRLGDLERRLSEARRRSR